MPRQISEKLTRKEMIDTSTPWVAARRPQLGKAGWYLRDHSRVKIEIPVDGHDAVEWGDGLLPPAAAKTGKCLRWYNRFTVALR